MDNTFVRGICKYSDLYPLFQNVSDAFASRCSIASYTVFLSNLSCCFEKERFLFRSYQLKLLRVLEVTTLLNLELIKNTSPPGVQPIKSVVFEVSEEESGLRWKGLKLKNIHCFLFLKELYGLKSSIHLSLLPFV